MFSKIPSYTKATLPTVYYFSMNRRVKKDQVVDIPVKNGDINKCLKPENWFSIFEFCH